MRTTFRFMKKLFLLLSISLSVSINSWSQTKGYLQVIRKKNDKVLFQVKEGAKVIYTDSEEHTYKGTLHILNSELIAIGKDTLPLNGFDQFWEQKQVETALGVGSLVLGVGSCLGSFSKLLQVAADTGSAAACASTSFCILGLGLLTGGIIELARLHKADGEKHKIIVVRKDY